MHKTKRMDPNTRRGEILQAALDLACEGHYRDVKLAQVAERARVVKGTVLVYFNTMDKLRREIMREAIARGITEIIAQGLGYNDQAARKAPKELRDQAAQLLIG